jgi:hypothetical protein
MGLGINCDMAVIGVLACEVLELEIATLLGADPKLNAIWVVKDAQSARLLSALKKSPSAHLLQPISDMSGFNADPSLALEVVVRILELGLHNNKKTLQDALIKAANKMAPEVNVLFLGYGLCGNALENPKNLFKDVDLPIFMPMDKDRPVDDCIALLLGGREPYYKEQMSCAGTYYMIPGWSFHWRRMFEAEFGKVSIDLAKRLFKNYKRSLMVPTPVMTEAEMKKNAAPFSKMFNLRVESHPGTMAILERTWEEAKTFLKTNSL